MLLENELLKLAAARIVQKNAGDKITFDKEAQSRFVMNALPWILAGAFGVSGGLTGLFKNIFGGGGGGGSMGNYMDTMRQMMEFRAAQQALNQDMTQQQKDIAAGGS